MTCPQSPNYNSILFSRTCLCKYFFWRSWTQIWDPYSDLIASFLCMDLTPDFPLSFLSSLFLHFYFHLKENLVHMYVEYSGTYIINKNAALEKYFFFFNFILDRNNFFGGFLFCKWTNKLYYFLKIAHEYLYIFTATLWVCILYTTFFSLDVFLAKTPITATFLDMFGILWALGLFSRG